jgi:hypothetical protein
MRLFQLDCKVKNWVSVIILESVQIDEQMKEAIQADCTRYAPGIEIIGVRVTKPTIPATIARNYERMEEERTKVSISNALEKLLNF